MTVFFERDSYEISDDMTAKVVSYVENWGRNVAILAQYADMI